MLYFHSDQLSEAKANTRKLSYENDTLRSVQEALETQVFRVYAGVSVVTVLVLLASPRLVVQPLLKVILHNRGREEYACKEYACASVEGSLNLCAACVFRCALCALLSLDLLSVRNMCVTLCTIRKHAAEAG